MRALARPAAAAPRIAETVPATLHASPVAGVEAAARQAQRFDDGYRDGLAAGHKEGFAEGFEQARARGRDEGFQAGQQQAGQAAQLEIERLRTAAAQAAQDHGQRIEARLNAMDAALRERQAQAEEEMLALCFEAVATVLGEFAARGEGVRSIVQQVLAQSRQLGSGVVHLHPQDLAAVEADLPSLLAPHPGRKLELLADERVALGGCVFSSPNGGLDARIETQLARLGEVFRRARSGQEIA
jgi:flagellar assembly protein FliH